MRSTWRTLDRESRRGITAIVAASFVSGLSFGAIAVASGMALWVPLVMSVLVFAGGSQFLAVGLVAAGGSPVAAVAAGLALNARHLPFGLAVGHLLGDRLAARLLGSHLLVDESVAFAMAQRDPARAKAAFWACGAGLFAGWNLGGLLGALAGQSIADPGALGLDAVFPALLLALVIPAMTGPDKWRPALAGAAIALATTPLLPAGVPVLLALLGMAAVPRRRATTDEVPA
ncbi:AzlC family ABC transporter permease [Actinokineospora pegani]|uniref:AzlC family ABC transporter permease n=1 Tax=Actinokineospora pegani TaxID=2654637 RepID=UPI0012EA07CF|nr:AzlC family ABC transporter permease [Actinokineospora pegani]